MAYAIIDIGGKQYRVEKGDSVVVDLVDAEPGSKLSPRAVLFADGSKSIAGGDADKIKVDAVVAEHVKGEKIRVFKYKAKKRYRVTSGHRSELTRLEITGISAPGGATKAAPKADDKPAEKPAAKKPAAKKPAAKKPAAKKPAAKKPAAKKPAPKKDD
jgi:large subunit ribosomal protein L21